LYVLGAWGDNNGLWKSDNGKKYYTSTFTKTLIKPDLLNKVSGKVITAYGKVIPVRTISIYLVSLYNLINPGSWKSSWGGNDGQWRSDNDNSWKGKGGKSK